MVRCPNRNKLNIMGGVWIEVNEEENRELGGIESKGLMLV